MSKGNPVVGQLLAGVISHQPAQAWMISLTGLTAPAISQLSACVLASLTQNRCLLKLTLHIQSETAT